jgi:hypothetical protein
LLTLVIVLAAQFTLLLSFKSDTISVSALGTSAVIISKAPYMSMSSQVSVNPYLPNSNVTMVFPNGTEVKVSDNGLRFNVFLAKSNKNFGSGVLTAGLGVSLTNSHPIDVSVVSNVTESFFSYGIYGGGEQYKDKFDIYWFKLQGKADVTINGIGVAI